MRRRKANESIKEAKRAIDFAKTKIPGLTRWGNGILEIVGHRQVWKNSGPKFDKERANFEPENVATAVAFLRRCRKDEQFKCSSYYLKHRAEQWGYDNGMEPYVANGELIVAAVYLDFPIRLYTRSINVSIGVSKRDLYAVCMRGKS